MIGGLVTRVTSPLFAAYVDCPTKCHLLSLAEKVPGHTYAEWIATQNTAYHAVGIASLCRGAAADRCISPLDPQRLRATDWTIAQEVFAQTQDLESCVPAVERVVSAGARKAEQCVPVRFVFANKIARSEKLRLAFDAQVLSKALGLPVRLGKIIHSDECRTTKVSLSALAGEVRKLIGEVTALLASNKPPDLALNRHCAECGFQSRCLQKLTERDDLSLLARMTTKERKKYRSKGLFTVTQLSYTFRPRKRSKNFRNRPEKYHHALKALAIREKKIHLVGAPELKIDGTPVYLDVEALPDRDFYYLIGARLKTANGFDQRSFWANGPNEEEHIWADFLNLLGTLNNPVLIHYGSFERTFLKDMEDRYGGPPEGSAAAKAVSSPINLLGFIYGRIYFPTYSNGLKEIAGFLGFKWSDNLITGLQTIVLRETWSQRENSSERRRLIRYNAEDCEALDLLTQKVLDLRQMRSSSTTADDEVVDTTLMKREHPYGFKRNEFASPEFDAINKGAYWDYQREKIYLRTNRHLYVLRKKIVRGVKISINKRVDGLRLSRCPSCGSRRIWPHCKHRRVVYDLKFSPVGVKRWIVEHRFDRYECSKCWKTFQAEQPGRVSGKFGATLRAYAIYQNIELALPSGKVDRHLNKLFGLGLPIGATHGFKRKAAELYLPTYEALLEKLRGGDLLHADETKIGVRGNNEFVWVFASLDTVAYVYTESRESEWLRDFLKEFKGVLVCDFYAGYDAIKCPKQRCLIHLLRDVNDDLCKNPYDESMRRLGNAFGSLVRPMVETVDHHGLKSRYLGKHQAAVTRFYRDLSGICAGGDLAAKWQARFEREREELFTFLRYDGVPWNNNNAEHAIKAFAVLRGVIDGVTSRKGLRDYLVLLSISETCKYQELDFLDFLRSGEKDIGTFRQAHTKAFKHKPIDHEAPPSARTYGGRVG
jgi:predicted RecB family nuclease